MDVTDLDERPVVGRALFPGDPGVGILPVNGRGEARLEDLELEGVEESSEREVSVSLELLQDVVGRVVGEVEVHRLSG